MPGFIREYLKRFAFRYTTLGGANYPYNLDPIELATLINEIERLRNVKGSIVEIGVARGMTTYFLATHLVRSGEQDQLLYAIDTFSSFPKAELDYEVTQRGKRRADLKGFGYNDYAAWCRHFRQFPFVKPIKQNCAEFDYSSIAPIKLAFLDVDLYLPTKRTLPLIYERLIAGGVILVDDVQDNHHYDGAYQAYREFCSGKSIAPCVVGKMCGLIRK